MTGHIPSPALKRDGIGRLAAQWQKFLAAASVAMLGAAGPAAAQNLNIDRIADRALSKLLGRDWPRTVEELERRRPGPTPSDRPRRPS